MKLYYTKGACSLVPRIILNELGLNVAFESVNLQTKITETGQNFFEINPKGGVPVLQMDNGEFLTENAVILQYLADNAKAIQLLPNVGDLNRYRVLEWLNYIATELHKGFSPLFNPNISPDLKETVFIPVIKSKLTYLNKHLQHCQYLLGENFTLPDAYLFVMLKWATGFKLELKAWPHLERYFTVLNNRESIQASLKQEG